MIEHLGLRTAIVSLHELGTNCWLPKRFVQDGNRCCRVWTCSYPEKKTCMAIQAEIKHMVEEQARLVTVYKNLDQRILELQNMLGK